VLHRDDLDRRGVSRVVYEPHHDQRAAGRVVVEGGQRCRAGVVKSNGAARTVGLLVPSSEPPEWVRDTKK
jgi:hypothetical protein